MSCIPVIPFVHTQSSIAGSLQCPLQKMPLVQRWSARKTSKLCMIGQRIVRICWCLHHNFYLHWCYSIFDLHKFYNRSAFRLSSHMMMTYYMMLYMQELNVILYAVIFVLSPSYSRACHGNWKTGDYVIFFKHWWSNFLTCVVHLQLNKKNSALVKHIIVSL